MNDMPETPLDRVPLSTLFGPKGVSALGADSGPHGETAGLPKLDLPNIPGLGKLSDSTPPTAEVEAATSTGKTAPEHPPAPQPRWVKEALWNLLQPSKKKGTVLAATSGVTLGAVILNAFFSGSGRGPAVPTPKADPNAVMRAQMPESSPPTSVPAVVNTTPPTGLIPPPAPEIAKPFLVIPSASDSAETAANNSRGIPVPTPPAPNLQNLPAPKVEVTTPGINRPEIPNIANNPISTGNNAGSGRGLEIPPPSSIPGIPQIQEDKPIIPAAAMIPVDPPAPGGVPAAGPMIPAIPGVGVPGAPAAPGPAIPGIPGLPGSPSSAPGNPEPPKPIIPATPPKVEPVIPATNPASNPVKVEPIAIPGTTPTGPAAPGGAPATPALPIPKEPASPSAPQPGAPASLPDPAKPIALPGANPISIPGATPSPNAPMPGDIPNLNRPMNESPPAPLPIGNNNPMNPPPLPMGNPNSDSSPFKPVPNADVPGFSNPTASPGTIPGADLKLTKPAGNSTVQPVQNMETRTGYDVDLHQPKSGETYATISKKYYDSERYAAALQEFNNRQPLGQGQDVRIPPMPILRKRYPQLIGTTASQPGNDPFRDSGSSGTGANWNTPAKAKPETYTVSKDGLTMHDVAEELYGDWRKWKNIHESNPRLDPNKLPRGTKLDLPSGLTVKRVTPREKSE